eukprot:scaffold8303_cov125-Skeletonema_marinoi.AAC.1
MTSINTMMKGGKEKPPAQPPSSIRVGEQNCHDIDDDDSSYSSDDTSSVMSSLSEKYRRLEGLRGSGNQSSASPQPPIHFINSTPGKMCGAVEFENDDKANMVATLMKNHGQDVSISLMERSCSIESIIRLSQHVPGCVIGSLLDDITRDRKERKERGNRRRRRGDVLPINKSWKSTSSEFSLQTCEEEKVYDGDQFSYPDSRMGSPGQRSIAKLGGGDTKSLPYTKSLPLSGRRESALLFVDISGFTKLSTMLDVDSFSNCINTYFQKVINQVGSYGGDILKFAGDAIFCEWRVSSHESVQTLEQCVLQAATCAADIVALCSDFNLVGDSGISRQRASLVSSTLRSSTHSWSDDLRASLQKADIDDAPQSPSQRRPSLEEGRRMSLDDRRRPSEHGQNRERRPSDHGHNEQRRPSFKRRVSIEAPFNNRPAVESTLNVKCGIGVGHMAGVHVGDNTSRREFVMLGDPIDQVAAAEAAASHGEVFASPEAIAYLTKMGSVRGDWKSNINDGLPTRLAVRGERFFYPKEEYTPCRGIGLPCEGEKLLRHFDDFDSSELNWLKRMISLYVHPVVVSEEHESSSHVKHETDYDRNVAAAELRNVYTCFISPKIDYNLTGDEEKDQKLFHRLNDIMTITTRHLDRAQGHLRQFILDDKG